MERLTVRSFDGSAHAKCVAYYDIIDKLAEYEDLEEQIMKKFAGCIDMKTILDSFCAFYDMQETNEELAQCTLLTNEDVLKYRQWKEAEEQGLLLIEPCDVEDIIDKLFSHNERVSLWVSVKEKITYHQLIYSGMAWDIPEVFKSCYFVKIFGTIPEKITQADIINIEVVLTKEAEQALARMEEKHE